MFPISISERCDVSNSIFVMDIYFFTYLVLGVGLIPRGNVFHYATITNIPPLFATLMIKF